MLKIKSDYDKYLEEFYLSIQLIVFIVILFGFRMLDKNLKETAFFLYFLIYGLYLLGVFSLYIRESFRQNSATTVLKQERFIVVEGLIYGAGILLFKDLTMVFSHILYVFLIIQSLRAVSKHKYFVLAYTVGLHTTALLLIGLTKGAIIDLLINIIIYTILNYIITNTIDHIHEMYEEKEIQKQELLQKNAVLKKMAYTDHLTDLNNHKSFYLYYKQLINRAKETGEVISLVLIDIDNFKKINDTYGHLTGDYLLRDIALVIKEGIRKTDFVSRYGGEEFAIIFANTSLDDAISISEKIRQRIEANVFEYDQFKINITISLGVGSYRPIIEFDQHHFFINEVDKLLYQAKRLGKNQIQSSEISMPDTIVA